MERIAHRAITPDAAASLSACRSFKIHHSARTNRSSLIAGSFTMQTETQVYRLKVYTSGRVVVPADLRQQNHIAEGDTIMLGTICDEL
jgi:AbrB family looped-hinge helix DNA binding protein